MKSLLCQRLGGSRLEVRVKARHAAIAGLLLTVVSAAPVAQTPDATPRLAFEVATIKRSTSLDPGGTLRMQPGGLFRSVNISVRSMMLGAYRSAGGWLFPSQIVGGPAWLSTDRYDITARVGNELATLPQAELFGKLPLLLQSLLEDRFRLTVHHETRSLPVYVLTLANKDGRLGPQLRASSPDCAADPNKCAIHFLTGHLSGGGIDLENLTRILSGPLERLVVDHTGLTGRFEFDLEWSPDQSASDKPSIFSAVQEQLGLRLESVREPVDVVVIDHVERPTED